MGQRAYISQEEREKCEQVIQAFAELFELEDSIVLDAGRFGYVLLTNYEECGECNAFENCYAYTDSRKLFEGLYDEWYFSTLYLIMKSGEYGDITELNDGYEEIERLLPEEKKLELANKRYDFASMAGIELD